ncbi:MAG: hypothetical protein ACI9DC_000300 [Gammaproteobacteria bacterium]
MAFDPNNGDLQNARWREPWDLKMFGYISGTVLTIDGGMVNNHSTL